MLEAGGYLVSYSIIFFINGLNCGTIGPLIPYLASETHRQQSDYSFVFICRSGGALLGAVAYKYLQYLKIASAHHKLIGICSLIMFSFCFFFNIWKSPVGTGVLLSLNSGLVYFINIAENCCILLVAPKQNLFLWLSICHGSYGVGSLIAPLVVNLLTSEAYIVSGLSYLALCPFYLLFMSSPQQKQEERLKRQFCEINEEEQSVNKEASTFLIGFLGINYFLLHGIENVNGGWISSYATMTKTSTKQEAAFFATIFWTSFTLSRFISGIIHARVSTKLKRLTQIGAIASLACTILSVFNKKHLATVLCSILQGISVSGVFPLTLALPYQYNSYVTEENLSNLMIIMMLSEGVLVAPTGFLMQKIKPIMFFVSLLVLNIAIFMNSRFIIYQLEIQSGPPKIEGEKPMKQFNEFYQAELL